MRKFNQLWIAINFLIFGFNSTDLFGACSSYLALGDSYRSAAEVAAEQAILIYEKGYKELEDANDPVACEYLANAYDLYAIAEENLYISTGEFSKAVKICGGAQKNLAQVGIDSAQAEMTVVIYFKQLVLNELLYSCPRVNLQG